MYNKTICLVGSLWMTVNRAWYTMGSPASVSNAKVNVKLQIQVNILLFYKGSNNTSTNTTWKNKVECIIYACKIITHMYSLWISSSRALTFPLCLIRMIDLAFDSQSLLLPPSMPTPKDRKWSHRNNGCALSNIQEVANWEESKIAEVYMDNSTRLTRFLQAWPCHSLVYPLLLGICFLNKCLDTQWWLLPKSPALFLFFSAKFCPCLVFD